MSPKMTQFLVNYIWVGDYENWKEIKRVEN